MKWTNEQPKTPGFYFWRRKYFDDRVVEVYSDDNGKLWVVQTQDFHNELGMASKNALWSDTPVIEPEETA